MEDIGADICIFQHLQREIICFITDKMWNFNDKNICFSNSLTAMIDVCVIKFWSQIF
jgi:hypothetical protein